MSVFAYTTSGYQMLQSIFLLFFLGSIIPRAQGQGGVPPRIDSIKTFIEGSKTELVCFAGGPDLQYSWEKFGSESSDWMPRLGITVSEYQGNILTISTTTAAHVGTYTCTVRNQFGTVSKNYDLQFSTASAPSNPLESENTGGIIGGIAATIVVVTLLLVWICMEFFRKAKNGLTKEEIQQFRYGNPEALRRDNAYAHENVDSMPFNHDLFEIKRENLHVDKMQVLGEGQYGRVLMGRFNHEKVAVKTVKPGVDKMYLKALLGEVKVMAHIGGHPNVIKLIGACSQFLRNGELFVVLEICELGSLESCLRKCTSFLNQFDSAGNLLEGKGTYENKVSTSDPSQYSNVEPSPNQTDLSTLSTRNILNWAIQVAMAMDFLASKKVIHGDLAARNVLLTSKRTAKITDFGLSRKLYDYSNYVKKNQEPLPWRWMAIESLRELSFSPQSDIWSYGVTVWEMFSFGDIPYPGLSWDNDFIKWLENNFRLQKPKFATDEIYWNLLLECWRINPNERPTFPSIIAYLQHVLAKKSLDD